MAKITGEGGYVKEASTTLAEIKEWDLNVATDVYDGSIIGDNWKENVAGLRSLTGTVMGWWYITDTGQAALQTAALGGTTLALHLSANGTNEYTGTAIINQIQIKSPVNGIVEVQFSFTSSGSWSYA